jgi:hypothetical protein
MAGDDRAELVFGWLDGIELVRLTTGWMRWSQNGFRLDEGDRVGLAPGCLEMIEQG